MSSRTTVLNSVSLNIVCEMSSLLECLEWEHTFALDANQPFDWMQWIEELVQIAKLPVYNIYSFCDAAAVFDMAQHAKYYNGNLKKYYNGFLLIIHGKLIEINSSAYNNIDIDEAWEYSEIRNSGVQAAKASSDFHLNFTY